jgi:segregation and condensation protein A
MKTEDYTVRLDAFEGPMDLLLYLIRRAELDITAISIARITDQFLKHLEHVDAIDIEAAADFLVVAATLVEIKSRTVSPNEESAEDDTPQDTPDADRDPGAELVRQLLAYKRYRDAGTALEEIRTEWERRHPGRRSAFDRTLAQDDAPEVDDVELYDLVQAFQRVLETVRFDRLGDHQVAYDDTPIAEHAADIIDRMGSMAVQRIHFATLFEGHNRSEMIGLFLAMLELVRQHRLEVEQDEQDAAIFVRLRSQEELDEFSEGQSLMPVAAAWEDDHILDDEDEDDDGEID